jgi:ABC-2 type transport system permease protein
MLTGTLALTERELKKWIRTPPLVFTSLFQPLVWLALFGNAFNPTKLAPPGAGQTILNQAFGGAPNYITYLTGGILCLILLFNAAFSGMSLVFDRRFSILSAFLAAPIPRTSIFLSRVLSSVVKGMIQALVIFGLALVIPNGLVLPSGFSALDFLGVFGAMFLLAFGFASLFTAIAVRIAKWETLIAIVNLLNLPLLFASSALLPTSSMPDWLQSVANVNPVTKAAEAARIFIIHGGVSSADVSTLGVDVSFLLGFAIFFTLLGVIASKLALKAE